MTTLIFWKDQEPEVLPAEAAKPPVIVKPEIVIPNLKYDFVEDVDWRKIQVRLRELGFYTAALDGVPGSATRKAVADFQIQHNVNVQRLGTVGPKTLAVLFPGAEKVPTSVEPPWMTILNGKMGWHEINDNKKLFDFLRSDKKSVGDPSKFPWCGDLVETCIARTLPDELLPTNPYLARNWLKFGQELPYFAYGCIVVFWRTHKTKSLNGHVGFGLKQYQNGNLRIRGGNQSNKITDSDFGKDRLLGFRWPKGWPLPPKSGAVKGGTGPLSVNEA